MSFQPIHTAFIRQNGILQEKDLPPHLQKALQRFASVHTMVVSASHPAIALTLLPVLQKADELILQELQNHQGAVPRATNPLELEALAIELELEFAELNGIK